MSLDIPDRPGSSVAARIARASAASAVRLLSPLAPVPVTGEEPLYTEADFAIPDSTRNRAIRGVAANTRRAYERQWKMFTDWCRIEGRVALPTTEHSLAAYVDDLCTAGQAPASIEQAIAAIRTMHRWADYRNQPFTDTARLVLRGYRNELVEDGRRVQRQSPPITISTLRAMVEACDLRTVAGIRNQALFVLGLALFGRREELAAVVQDDVREVDDGLEITIRTSKTDRDSKGETIGIWRGEHPLTDPVAVWRNWTRVLAEHGQHGGRLLRRVDQVGRIGPSLSGDSVNTLVREIAIQARVPGAEHYTAHSLRAGGATVSYAAGHPVSVIAEHGRWNIGSPVLLATSARSTNGGKTPPAA